MRKVLSAQLALGVLLALVGSHFALRSYLGPALAVEADRAAQAEARAATADVLLAWRQLLDTQRGAAQALARGPTLFTLASELPAADRPKALAAALASAKSGAGGAAQVGLFDRDGKALVDGPAAALATLGVTQAAQAGATSTRVELLGDQAHLVAAAPVGDGPDGVLVLATPIDGPLVARLAPGGAVRVGLWREQQLIASTRGEGAPLTRPSPGATAQVGDEPAQTAERSLEDDAGQALQVVAFAPVGGEFRAPIAEHLALGLWILGGALLLLVVVVPLLSGESPVVRERATGMTPVPTVGRTIEPLPATPAPALQLKFQAPPDAVTEAEPLSFPEAPSLDEELAATFSKKTLPSHPAPPPAPTPVVAEPLPAWATPPLSPAPTPAPSLGASFGAAPSPAPFSAPSPPPAPRAEPSLFDAIASAAISAPPPAAAKPAPAAPLSREDGDLPVPKEGLSPEILAAQRAATQRAAHAAPAPAPPPVFSGRFDDNLPAPKGGPMPASSAPPRGVSAPSLAPRPAPPPRSPSFPSAAPSPVSAPPPAAPAIPLAGSVAARAPSVPPFAPGPAPIPLPGARAGQGAIPLPGSQGLEPREPIKRTNTVPGETPPYNPSSLPFASAAPAPARSSTLDLPKSDSPNEVSPFDEEHYRVVYNEFVASKARLGEAVDNITYEGFRTKLRSSEQALLDRHKCRAVRFQVLVKDKTVSLRPQLVR